LDGALLIYGTRSVHTLGARFAIDVAYCVDDRRPGLVNGAVGAATPGVGPGGAAMITVIDATSMAPFRIGRPRPRARCVLAADAGAFERWRLRPGDRLEVR
jgi:hypothetical protein